MTFCVEVRVEATEGDLVCQILISQAEVFADFLGMDEGSVSDETLSTFDVGEVDPERDWVKTAKGERSIKFYFRSENSSLALKNFVHRLGLEKKCTIGISKVEDEDYGRKWRDSFEGVDVAKTWSIRPDWSQLSVEPHRRLIRLNPSFGFGFGNHPTTQACLEFLESFNDLKERRFLDFGSGSGILSLAACLLGAHEVVAIEIEDAAREAALDLFKRNACDHLVQSFKFLPSNLSFGFDVIAANIISSVLKEQAKFYLPNLSDQSRLIVSGILDHEFEEMKSFFDHSLQEYGFKIINRKHLSKDSWNSFLFQLERR